MLVFTLFSLKRNKRAAEEAAWLRGVLVAAAQEAQRREQQRGAAAARAPGVSQVSAAMGEVPETLLF